MTSEGTDRIPYITERDQVPDGHQERYDELAESRGAVKGPFSVLLHSPEVAGRVGHLGAYLRFDGGLPGPVRELAILTVARELNCAFEWAYHEPLAREEGVSADAIDNVDNSGSLGELAGDEYLVVAFTRQLLRTHSVSDDVYSAVLDRFGEQRTVELVATIGYYAMLAFVLNAFEVTPAADT